MQDEVPQPPEELEDELESNLGYLQAASLRVAEDF